MQDAELLIACVMFGLVLAMLAGHWIFDTHQGR